MKPLLASTGIGPHCGPAKIPRAVRLAPCVHVKTTDPDLPPSKLTSAARRTSDAAGGVAFSRLHPSASSNASTVTRPRSVSIQMSSMTMEPPWS